jgi:hypothetical protein
MTPMIKQIRNNRKNKVPTAIVEGIEALISFQLIKEISRYFYTGQFSGKISPVKIRAQQLVSKSQLTNSYMIGLMTSQLFLYAKKHFHKHNKLKSSIAVSGKSSLDSIKEGLDAYKNAYNYQTDIVKEHNNYSSLYNYRFTPQILFKQNTLSTKFTNLILEYSRPISHKEYIKGIIASVDNTQTYYRKTMTSLESSRKTQDAFPIIIKNLINNNPNYSLTHTKRLITSQKDQYTRMVQLFKLIQK